MLRYLRFLRVSCGILALVSAIMLSSCAFPPAQSGATTPTPSLVIPTATPACPPGAYCAKIPGPSCDSGAAHWFAVNNANAPITCTATGLQMSAPAVASNAVGSNAVGFTPPSATLGGAYSIAATVDLSKLPDGCFSLATFTNVGNQVASYDYGVCANGRWFIILGAPSVPAQSLASGQAALASGVIFRVSATSNGANRSLSVNGVAVGSAVNAAYTSADFAALLVVNNGTVADSALISDFVYNQSATG